MKISQLSARSGVPVPTIKFYLRENLLPAGTPSRVNQHRYDHTHLQRLALIQTLSQTGGIPIAQIREILLRLGDYPPHQFLGQALLSGNRGTYTNDEYADAMTTMQALVKVYQWKINPASPALLAAAAFLASMRAFGLGDMQELLDRLADHADALAFDADPADTPEHALVAAVLSDKLFTALMRLAEENVYATTGKENHDG